MEDDVEDEIDHFLASRRSRDWNEEEERHRGGRQKWPVEDEWPVEAEIDQLLANQAGPQDEQTEDEDEDSPLPGAPKDQVTVPSDDQTKHATMQSAEDSISEEEDLEYNDDATGDADGIVKEPLPAPLKHLRRREQRHIQKMMGAMVRGACTSRTQL